MLAALEIPLGVQFAPQRATDAGDEGRARRDHDRVDRAGHAPERDPRRLQAIAGIAYRYRRDTGGRVVIVNRAGRRPDGHERSGSGVTSFASRPEIVSALQGNVAPGRATRGRSTHGSSTSPFRSPPTGGSGAVRITYPTSAVDSRIRRYWLVLAAIAAIVRRRRRVVGLAVATFVARPLRQLEAAAAAVGAGDLKARAPEHEGPPEVRSLAACSTRRSRSSTSSLRAQEEFVADASHQLRTPLTALSLRLENLARDVAPRGARSSTARSRRSRGSD